MCRMGLAFSLATLIVCSSSTFAAPPSNATMQFGNTGTGSPFPPPLGHDESVHAADKLVPRTVVISVGGTVDFVLSNPVHGIAVYAPGTEPDDLNTATAGFLGGPCPPVPYLNDPAERRVQFPPLCAGGNPVGSYQFMAPGRYLVICTFLPHLFDADMFGWVIVK